MRQEDADDVKSELTIRCVRASNNASIGINSDYYLGIAEGFRQAHQIISAALANQSTCDHFACVMCIKKLPDPTEHSTRCPNRGKL